VSFDWHVLQRYWPMLLEGLRETVLVTFLVLAAGMVLGLCLCALSLRRRGRLFRAARLYIDLFRTVPEMVLIFWVYFCLPPLLGWTLSGFAAGALALTLVAAAYLAEIFRAGIEAIPRGQVEAARALALPRLPFWAVVMLPQAVRKMLPAFVNYFTEILKNSALLSAIGVAELVYQASILGAQTFRYMEFLSAVAAAYFAVIFPLSLILRRAEHQGGRQGRQRPRRRGAGG
jgi:His/Glu/Gln/Arg/opine family amino acid ABC transporter permease subunit